MLFNSNSSAYLVKIVFLITIKSEGKNECISY